MHIIETINLENWPSDVILGISEITTNLSQDGLSAVEREEFGQFSNERRKTEFLSVRRLFRFVLERLDIDPINVQLNKQESGKPVADYRGKTIHVSFSHSNEYVFCAVSESFDIGLDAELINRNINARILNRILNDHETQKLAGEPPVKLWTIKEATVKCLGTGLRTNLKDITISKNKKNRFSARFNDDKWFEICNFQQSNHQIALAYQSKKN